MNACFTVLVLLLCLQNFQNCQSENLELLILHNNDMHARFEETSKYSGKCKPGHKGTCYGGFARTAHVIRKARKAAEEGKGPNVLYLNAGDTFTGTPWYSVHKWKIASEFLNLLHPDAASFGNHEFDEAVAGVVPFLNAASFPVIAANLDFSKEPTLAATNVTKSVILEVEGVKIGVIGYLTPDTVQISIPGNVIFNDEIISIKQESERLDEQGVKIIIALGHSGYNMDKKIATECPLVDLVVGGHTNTFLWNGPKPDIEEPEGPYPTVVEQINGKKVPVVQAYAYTKYIGRLNIIFNDQGDAIKYSGQPLLLNNSVPQEQDFLDHLVKYRPAVDALDSEIVGRSRVILDGSVESCRFKECNLGNLITDAYVAYHSSVYGGSHWTDTPIAFVVGGAIRNTIEPKATDGSITRGELLSAMPYGDPIISMFLNGSDLLKTLEIGVRSNGETSHGELLQVSGIRYRFDVTKPVGSRVIEAKVRCSSCRVPVYEPINPRKTYRIITTEFVNSGGDGHYIIKEKGYKKVIEDMNDIDTVTWYMKNKALVYSEEEERIIAIGREDKKTISSKSGARMRFPSISLDILTVFGIHFYRYIL